MHRLRGVRDGQRDRCGLNRIDHLGPHVAQVGNGQRHGTGDQRDYRGAVRDQPGRHVGTFGRQRGRDAHDVVRAERHPLPGDGDRQGRTERREPGAHRGGQQDRGDQRQHGCGPECQRQQEGHHRQHQIGDVPVAEQAAQRADHDGVGAQRAHRAEHRGDQRDDDENRQQLTCSGDRGVEHRPQPHGEAALVDEAGEERGDQGGCDDVLLGHHGADQYDKAEQVDPVGCGQRLHLPSG